MPDVIVLCTPASPNATLVWQGQSHPCVIGRNGPVAAEDKREGDGHTPLGRYPFTMGFYRADRRAKPPGTLHWHAIQPGDGISDVADNPNYNTFVTGKEPGSGGLWQDGTRHDASLFIGYNTQAPVPGMGSAIMLHGRDKPFTAGCIALDAALLATIANQLNEGDGIDIRLA